MVPVGIRPVENCLVAGRNQAARIHPGHCRGLLAVVVVVVVGDHSRRTDLVDWDPVLDLDCSSWLVVLLISAKYKTCPVKRDFLPPSAIQ